jgi:hypothetical protein
MLAVLELAAIRVTEKCVGHRNITGISYWTWKPHKCSPHLMTHG